MKKPYVFLLSGALLMSTGLMSCSGENTTGVETGTVTEEVDDNLNDNMIQESPMDTATNPMGDTSNMNNSATPPPAE